MIFRHVRIETLAWIQPPVCVTSADIEMRLAPAYERLRLPEGRLELMTGIQSRHFWEKPILPSWAAAQAGAKALEQSSVSLEKLGALIHSSVCRDRLEPATASYVHRQLNLPRSVQIFDVSNACLGFLNSMALVGAMIDAGQIQAALIVSGEDGLPLLERTIQQFLDPAQTRKSVKNLFANLTIGAGAVAAIICHESLAPDAPRLLGGAIETDTSHNDLCEGGSAADGLEMLTDSEALLEAGLDVAGRNWRNFLEVLGWSSGTPQRVICHQVGRAHQRRLLEQLGIDPAKDFVTYPFMGNTGSAALPLTLAHAAEMGTLQKGDDVALLGIGSGLSSIMLGLRW